MSQDLLSFFLEDSSAPEAPASQPLSPAAGSNNTHNSWTAGGSSAWQEPRASQAQPAIDDDDDFGDFEDASAQNVAPALDTKSRTPLPWDNAPSTSTSKVPARQPSAPPRSNLPFKPKTESEDVAVGRHPFANHMDLLFSAGDDEYDAGADELGDLATNPEAAMAYSKRLIAEQEAAAAAAALQQGQKNQSTRMNTERSSKLSSPRNAVKPTTPQKDPNVLFDADNLSESEDDFGGFESGNETEHVQSAKAQQSKPSTMPAIDLLGLDDDISLSSISNAPVEISNISQPSVAPPSMKGDGRPVAPTREQSATESDSWDDFKTKVPTHNPDSTTNTDAWEDFESKGPTNHSYPAMNTDSWGNFETKAPTRSPYPATNNDAWGNFEIKAPTHTPYSAPNTDSWEDFEAKPPTHSSYAATNNDAWEDFDAESPAHNPWATDSSNAPRFHSNSPPPHHSNPPKSSEATLPPTNIPPPAVLISLFPSIMSEADGVLFNAISRLDLKQRQMLLGHPASHQFLKGYLAHAAVMTRILAGRKLRWKRDQHLTQSMRIGPAAAGGKGGMKLTGLDKAESAKEDREAVDALRLWRNQVGKVRTAVTAASAAPGMTKLPPVPEIAEQMPIRVLKAAEGGITASHACALCGLKREERVGKVDVEVNDSFGEWWVQGMNMHLSCREFWNEYERNLKSR